MRKFIAILLTAALILPLGVTTAFAAQTEAFVNVNGQAVEYPDQKPYNDGEIGRVFVPIRATLNAFGYDDDHILWDQATQTVTVIDDAVQLETKVDLINNTYSITQDENVWEGKLDVDARLENGRTMVPIRTFSETFFKAVGWDQESQTVLIDDVYEKGIAELDPMVTSELTEGDFVKVSFSTDGTYTYDVSTGYGLIGFAVVAEGAGQYTAYFYAPAPTDVAYDLVFTPVAAEGAEDVTLPEPMVYSYGVKAYVEMPPTEEPPVEEPEDGRTVAEQFEFVVEDNEEWIVADYIFNEDVTVSGGIGNVVFENCVFNGDVYQKSETGTRLFINATNEVNGKIIIQNDIKEGSFETSLPKVFTNAPFDVTCDGCIGAVVGMNDSEVSFNGQSYTVNDAENFFDLELGIVAYEGQKANIIFVAQWWENGEQVLFTYAEYDASADTDVEVTNPITEYASYDELTEAFGVTPFKLDEDPAGLTGMIYNLIAAEEIPAIAEVNYVTEEGYITLRTMQGEFGDAITGVTVDEYKTVEGLNPAVQYGGTVAVNGTGYAAYAYVDFLGMTFSVFCDDGCSEEEFVAFLQTIPEFQL